MKTIEDNKTGKADTKLSIRDFVRFSFFLYPFAVIILFNYDSLVKFFYKPWVLFVFLFLVFMFINWVWGQIKLKNWPLLISALFGVVLYFLDIYLREEIYDIGLQVLTSAVIYIIAFPVFQFIQFSAWIPFLIKYLHQNRYNLNNLKWQ